MLKTIGRSKTYPCVAQMFLLCIFYIFVSMVVLESWDKVLWSVKYEVRLTIVIVPKSMKNLSRGEKKVRLEVEVSQKK